MENNKKEEEIAKIYKLWVHDIIKDAYENRKMSRLTVIEVAYLVAEAKKIELMSSKKRIPKKWQSNPWDGYGIYSSVHTALKALVKEHQVREENVTPKRKKKNEGKRETKVYTYNDISYIRKIKEEEICGSVELADSEIFYISKNTIAIKAYCKMTKKHLKMFEEFIGEGHSFSVSKIYGAISL